MRAHTLALLVVVLATLAAQGRASVLTSRAQAQAGQAAVVEAETVAAHKRMVAAELFDEREKWMHPSAPHELRDSADDHGNNTRPAGPVEEQDPKFWKDQAKKTIEENLLQRKEIKGVAKNVIIFMGDGMSVPTLAATRMYMGNENKQLSFEKFPAVGLSKTYCVDTQVADSVCSATAYLCGVKANMGTMGVSASVPKHNCTEQQDASKHVDSVLAWGMAAGKWAGVVTTTRITHASPGGAYAHIANRDWEDDAGFLEDKDAVGVDAGCKDIARQLVEDAPGKDLRVILGGGRRAFLPKGQGKGRRLDGKNLVEAWTASKAGAASSYVTTKQELEKVDLTKTDYLLGLFEWSHIQYHLDADETQPTLASLVETAIKVLSRQEKGFVLFVEGGRIDHGHHDTMAHYALDETVEFSKAIQKAVDLTKDEDTLIAVTSDHAHTMSMAGYAQRSNPVFDFGGVDKKSNEAYTTISYANGPGYHAEKDGSRHDPSKDDRTVKDYEFPATAYLNSETHGGDDVGIFARGPWAHLYTGVHEQNMIPHIAAYAAAIGPFKDRAADTSSASSVQVALAALLCALVLPLWRLL